MVYFCHFHKLRVHIVQSLQCIRVDDRKDDQKRQVDRKGLVSDPDEQHDDEGDHRHGLEHHDDRLKEITDQFESVTDQCKQEPCHK